MGFFDKKKSLDDDDDEPVAAPRPAPKVSSALLGASPSGLPKPARPDVQTASQLPRPATGGAASSSEVTIVDTSLPATPAASASASPEPGGFGIDDVVRLVRQLPSRDLTLVMQVVTKTLESVRVDVGRIIEGAVHKERAIDERVALLRQEIERREAEILASKKEIAELEAEEREISVVRERLMMAHAAPEAASGPAVEPDPKP